MLYHFIDTYMSNLHALIDINANMNNISIWHYLELFKQNESKSMQSENRIKVSEGNVKQLNTKTNKN